jgi:signal transduction histidine kinase
LKSGLFGAMRQEQCDVLDRIEAAARFINRLANDLVDTAASETQRLALIVEDFDPQQIAAQVMGACEIEARSKGLALVRRSEAAPATIAGDSDRLQQILLNLVSNAVRYTEKGSITLAVAGADETIEFRVEDTGPGISKEAQEQIWQRYTRATTRGPGLGLGLYVVRQLVGAMGGSVGVESTPGAGSCFWVRLPVHGPRPQSFHWT